MNLELWLGLAALVITLLVAGFFVFRRRPTLPTPGETKTEAKLPEAQTPLVVVTPPAEKTEPVVPGLAEKLGKTRGSLLGKLGRFVGIGAGIEIPKAEWEGLEEALLEGDVGMTTTTLLLERMKKRVPQNRDRDLKELLVEETESLISGLPHGISNKDWPKPYVISVVGVNGAGKTTTIGKLAHQLQGDGKKVLLGACDTFRAAAIGQLKVWAERSQAQFVTGREGGDPGAVAFDAISAGKARGMDVVLLDTAGRLHTKANLMEELKKVHRVMKKVMPEAPHETWLVVDGTTGQNAVNQAREFQKALDLTGIIITKLDGTAKGGAILAIASELKLPIKLIGVGEGLGDLIPFEPHAFVKAILN